MTGPQVTPSRSSQASAGLLDIGHDDPDVVVVHWSVTPPACELIAQPAVFPEADIPTVVEQMGVGPGQH